MAKVFDFTPDFETVINADEVIYGGTGYDLQNKLPDEIEHIYPDYSLYGIKNTAYDTTHEEDLHRIYKLKELGYDPYLMIYDKQNAPKRLKQMQRWVNNKFIFRSGQAETFEDYLRGVTK